MNRTANNVGAKPFLDTLEKLSYGRFSPWEIWQDFVTMTACAISNATDRSPLHFERREQMYMERMRKYEEGERRMFQQLYLATVLALEADPDQDFLGEMYMQLGLGNERQGQFFTPYHLCEAMAGLSTPDAQERIKENGYVTVVDPTCGAGATLLGMANSLHNRSLSGEIEGNWQLKALFIGQDIDFTVGMMCYIQLSLRGCAGFVKIGDSLAKPLSEGEDDAEYWYTTMYFHEVWECRRMMRAMDDALRVKGRTNHPPSEKATTAKPEPKPKEEPKPQQEKIYNATEEGQLMLF